MVLGQLKKPAGSCGCSRSPARFEHAVVAVGRAVDAREPPTPSRVDGPGLRPGRHAPSADSTLRRAADELGDTAGVTSWVTPDVVRLVRSNALRAGHLLNTAASTPMRPS